MTLHFRPYTPTDAPAVLELNRANEPEVGPLTEAGLSALAAAAPFFPVVFAEDRLVGYLLALGEGAEYGSPNYRWFSARFRNFLYIDRVAFAPDCRRLGAGREVYRQAEQFAARAGLHWLLCEVNTEPPNPISLAFHAKLGFVPVGEQLANGKQVRMLARPVAAVTPPAGTLS